MKQMLMVIVVGAAYLGGCVQDEQKKVALVDGDASVTVDNSGSSDADSSALDVPGPVDISQEVDVGCKDDEACDDSDLCTVDHCTDGICINTPKCDNFCVDGECQDVECTEDSQCGEKNACACNGDTLVCQVSTAPCVKNKCTVNIYEDDCPLGCEEGECKEPECQVDAECNLEENCMEYWCEEGLCYAVGVVDCCVSDANCDDSDSCTNDSCDNSTCSHVPKCLDSQKCIDGQCFDVECFTDDHCEETTECSCNGKTLHCEGLSGACVSQKCATTQSDLECPYGCSNAVCLPPECNFEFNCKDGTACDNVTCEEGLCVYTPISDCCLTDDDCPSNDDPCLMPVCQGNSCYFVEVPDCCYIDSECDDQDFCTVDSCEANVCTHQPLDCPEGAQCLSDQEQCEAIPCTIDDDCPATTLQLCSGELVRYLDYSQKCVEELCQVEQHSLPCYKGCNDQYCICSQDADCADGIAHTLDTCGEVGCENQPMYYPNCVNAGQCDDDDVCTKDVCELNTCLHTPIAGCQ